MADDIKLSVGVDYTELTGLIKTASQTKRVLSGVAKDFANTGSQKQYMASINKLVAAQKKLPLASRLSRSEIMKLGAQMKQEVKFTNALTAATSRLADQQTRAKASSKLLADNQMAATKASNRLGVVTQQAGYQVSDFVVQVQSGANPLVAFSQQASQLVGVLPLVASQLGLTTKAAIALSASLGIIIPVVSAAAMIFLNMRNSSEEAEKQVDEYKKTIDSLSSSVSKLTDAMELNHSSVDYAITKYGRLTKDVKDFLKVTKELAEYEVIEETGKAFEQLINTKEFVKVTGELSGLKKDITDAEAKLREEIAGGQEEDILNNLREEIAQSEAAYASLAATLEDMPEGKLMALSEEFLNASDSRNIQGMTDAITGIRNVVNELPADVRLNMLKMVVQMEAQLRRLQSSVEKTTELDAFGGLGESNELIKESIDLTNEEARERAKFLRLINTQKRDYTVLNNQQQKQIDDQITLFEKSQELTKEIGQAGKEALILAGVDIAKPIDDATKSAAKLVTELGVSLGLAEKLVAISVMGPERSKFNAKVRAGLVPPQAAGDFDVEGGETPFALQQYLDSVNNKNKDKTKKTKRDPLADLQKQIELEQALVGKTQARQRIIQSLGVDFEKYGDKTINNLEAQINKTIELEEAEKKRQQTIEEARQQQEALGNFIEDSFEGAMMSIVDGTKSVEDAFRTMAAEIVKELYRVLVVQQAVAAFKTAGKILGIPFFEEGAAFSNGRVTPFADGGVVASPTYFPMAGGNTGLMGEAGPEAIMPLKRGKDGKLGVQAEGGGTTIVNQTINVSTGVQQTVRTEIKSLMPQIAEGAKSAVLDAKRRGGAYGRTL